MGNVTFFHVEPASAAASERRLSAERAATASARDCAGRSRRDLPSRCRGRAGGALRCGAGDGAESSVERGLAAAGGPHVELDHQNVAGGHRCVDRGRDLEVRGALGLLRDFDAEHRFERPLTGVLAILADSPAAPLSLSVAMESAGRSTVGPSAANADAASAAIEAPRRRERTRFMSSP